MDFIACLSESVRTVMLPKTMSVSVAGKPVGGAELDAVSDPVKILRTEEPKYQCQL